MKITKAIKIKKSRFVTCFYGVVGDSQINSDAVWQSDPLNVRLTNDAHSSVVKLVATQPTTLKSKAKLLIHENKTPDFFKEVLYDPDKVAKYYLNSESFSKNNFENRTRTREGVLYGRKFC
jgi:hypothetical protein